MNKKEFLDIQAEDQKIFAICEQVFRNYSFDIQNEIEARIKKEVNPKMMVKIKRLNGKSRFFASSQYSFPKVPNTKEHTVEPGILIETWKANLVELQRPNHAYLINEDLPLIKFKSVKNFMNHLQKIRKDRNRKSKRLDKLTQDIIKRQ